MSKHTELPWMATKDSWDGDDLIRIQDGDGFSIAIITHLKPVDKANAAFIVTCVNSHQHLGECLEMCLEFLPEKPDYSPHLGADSKLRNLYNEIEAALKLAKGE